MKEGCSRWRVGKRGRVKVKWKGSRSRMDGWRKDGRGW